MAPKALLAPGVSAGVPCILLCLGRQSGVLFVSAGASGVLTVPMAIFAL